MTGAPYGHIGQFLFPTTRSQQILGSQLGPPFGTSDFMTAWSNTWITQSSHILSCCNLDLDDMLSYKAADKNGIADDYK
jgi:hypothetical protein